MDILKYQQRLGHDLTLVVINDCYDEDYLDKLRPSVNCVTFNRKPGSFNPWIVVRLNQLLWRLRPDAVHLHNNEISKILFCPRPGYLTVHALGISLSTTCKKLKELFAISESVAEDVEKRYPGKYRVRIIPNGIRIDDISRKHNYSLQNGKMRVVQVARLEYDKKGQDLLIEAVSMLRKRGVNGISVDFIGEGGMQNELEQMAKSKEVDDVVHFVGVLDRDELYRKLKNYDLMCHPSRYEGFGLVVAEGMAAGLPVLVPDQDGPYDIIQYGKYGYSFKKGDVMSLANALQDIYENYEERAALTVDAAYNHVLNNYSIQRMVEQYIEEYQKFKG